MGCEAGLRAALKCWQKPSTRIPLCSDSPDLSEEGKVLSRSTSPVPSTHFSRALELSKPEQQQVEPHPLSIMVPSSTVRVHCSPMSLDTDAAAKGRHAVSIAYPRAWISYPDLQGIPPVLFSREAQDHIWCSVRAVVRASLPWKIPSFQCPEEWEVRCCAEVSAPRAAQRLTVLCCCRSRAISCTG